jgi:hypothetical protein
MFNLIRFVTMSVATIMLFSSFIGCAGYCQYRGAYWDKRTAVEKMAITKLEKQPVKADSTNGYWGIVANHSYDEVTAVFEGPESFSVLLSSRRHSGSSQELYLLPGKYLVKFMAGDRLLTECTIHSGVQKSYYQGISVHWFASFRYFNQYAD